MAPGVYPYVKDQHLILTDDDDEKIKYDAAIIHSYPVTSAPAMEVRLKTSKGYKRVLLKLFDRRFGHSRRDCPHNAEVEDAWRDHVAKGKAEQLFRAFERIDDLKAQGKHREADEVYEEPECPWECLAEDEGKRQYDALSSHRREVRAYKTLKALQGSTIPRFIASVTLDVTVASCHREIQRFFGVRGILLQFINGFKLSRLTQHAQKTYWEQIISDTMQAARRLNQYGVVHEDFEPRNVMVARQGADEYQPYIIDFAKCTFESDCPPEDDENDWGSFESLRVCRDNPTAIAHFMQVRLHKEGYTYEDIEE
ncbi:Protein kinase-like domain protein [Moelleriella libera RCEF 2490]|uniref:Protein kinase-like domain protein n=1 Tax=Moelleriella libera RCEF 2490 TaxID=1081109 RepID=A0A168B3G3_9HYPO|nr:Protein kinase-like domain protein [Moelleriella libera RCEF 2490]